MGKKPVPTNKFIDWLKRRGLEYKRTTSSHDVWDYPEDSKKSLLRPVIIRMKDKDIPGCHIHTNLRTMGVSYKEFLNEIKKF